MNTNNKLGIVAISTVLAVSTATALGAAGVHDKNETHDGMGEMNPRGGMMNMMRGKGGMMGMMDSCPMMRGNDTGDGDTGRPNSQWREKAPDPGNKGG